jgi:hypothetical protein
LLQFSFTLRYNNARGDKMYTLDDYLEAEQSFTMEEANKMHRELIDSLMDGVEYEMYDAIIKASVHYMAIRTRWNIYKEERDNDQRTIAHNAVIEAFDNLADYQEAHNREADWRDAIGYKANGKYYRKRIGDFGLYLAFLVGLEAR